MGASRWDPSQHDPTDASQQLAQHLRFLLDREGLTPRQLADENDVPYSPTMLYRFFSGDALPPPQLIEVVARRCRGDLEGLQSAYDRARLSAVGVFAGSSRGRSRSDDHAQGPRPRHRKPKPQRKRPRMAAGVGFSTLGAIVLTTAAVNTVDHQSAADTAADRQRQQQRPAAQAPAARPAPSPSWVLIPKSSQRNSSVKEKPKASPTPTPRPPDAPADVPAPVAALLNNGTFTGTVAPWVGTTGLALTPENDQMRIGVPRQENDAPNGGLVRSNSFPLESGRTYQLRFDASANQQVSMVTVVQTQGGSLQNVLVAPTRLSGSQTSQAFTFTIDDESPTAPGTVVFQLSALQDRYSVSIDNVSVVQTG